MAENMLSWCGSYFYNRMFHSYSSSCDKVPYVIYEADTSRKLSHDVSHISFGLPSFLLNLMNLYAASLLFTY